MKIEPRNPPAFPAGPHEGMTLRDYFAAKAMQAITQGVINSGIVITEHEIAVIADHAYIQADAMLAQRERDND